MFKRADSGSQSPKGSTKPNKKKVPSILDQVKNLPDLMSNEEISKFQASGSDKLSRMAQLDELDSKELLAVAYWFVTAANTPGREVPIEEMTMVFGINDNVNDIKFSNIEKAIQKKIK